MDFENRKQSFQEHHTNTFNIVFHIGCGLLFMSFLLSSVPPWGFWIYTLLVLSFFPYFSVGSTLVILWILTTSIRKLRLPLLMKGLAIGIFYMLPEVSHWIADEKPVLQMESLTLFDAFDNFFFLLPQSVICLTKSR